MSQYEQLGRNPTNCFTLHKNRYEGGPERNGRRNGLQYRHTIADKILRTDKATVQLGICEPFKRANRENQASPDHATRREENLRVPRARNITVHNTSQNSTCSTLLQTMLLYDTCTVLSRKCL